MEGQGPSPSGDGPWSSASAGRCTTTCSSRPCGSRSARRGLVAALDRGGRDLRPRCFAFALGAFGFGVSMVSADRVFAGGTEAVPAPPHVVESRLSTLAAAVWPSTVGVAVLLVISLGVNATLAALLAGVEAGMGVAGLLSAMRIAGARGAARRAAPHRPARERRLSRAIRPAGLIHFRHGLVTHACDLPD